MTSGVSIESFRANHAACSSSRSNVASAGRAARADTMREPTVKSANSGRSVAGLIHTIASPRGWSLRRTGATQVLVSWVGMVV